jgi:carboxymethylenebutenolidase
LSTRARDGGETYKSNIMSEERIDITTTDGSLDSYLQTPEGQGPWPLVVVYMDAFGIRPSFLRMAQRLASHGYAVVVPNLYYRHGAFAPFDPHAVAAGGAERDRFRSMIGSISDTLVMRDTARLLDALASHPAVRPGPMAAVGYCMGGGFALSAAGTFPERVVAAAAFHGGSLATAKPDSPHLLAPSIRASVYVGVAGIDPTFDEAQRERLETALKDAGVRYVLEIYEGAKHGFAVNEHLAYDKDASERHWRVLVKLLHDTLGSPVNTGTRAGG